MIGEWGMWGECSVDCGSGKRERTRECLPAMVCPNCDNMATPCMCTEELEDDETCGTPFSKYRNTFLKDVLSLKRVYTDCDNTARPCICIEDF